MKVYISADIEGITGVTSWNETEKNLPDWDPFAIQMSEEVNAAVLGSIEAGATDIVVKDAHDSGKNIDIRRLPETVKLIRGWVGDPLSMITTIDNSFDALILVGYHTYSGGIGNPLAHTMNSTKLNYIKINEVLASEFLLNTYAAALYDVPVIFVSGDYELTQQVAKVNPNIKTLSVKEGVGNATINIHPDLAIKLTKLLVKDALCSDLSQYKVTLPNNFYVEICYKEHFLAYKLSYYPGAVYQKPNIVTYHTNNFYDVMRLINFLT